MKAILFTCLLLICSPLSNALAQGSSCPNPRVGVKLNDITDEAIGLLNETITDRNRANEAWINEISALVIRELTSQNPNVTFFSVGEIPTTDYEYIFRFDIKVKAVGERVKYDDFGNPIKYATGWVFQMDSDITPHHLCGSWAIRPFSWATTQENELNNLIMTHVVNHSDIEANIKEQERKNPVPPRSPTISYQVAPVFVSPLQEDRKAELKVTVLNCEGKPVYEQYHGQYVYYSPRESQRATITISKNYKGFDDGNTVVVRTREDGMAKADYELEKGISASREEVKVITCGLVTNMISDIATIQVKGLEIDIKPDRKSIYTNERTDITLTFSKVDPDGEKEPISDKTLTLKFAGIADGSVTKGPYVTDEKGEISIKYKAGEDDRKIKITAEYQPEDYPDKVEKEAVIQVKPLAYDATIVLKKKIVKQVVSHKEDDTSTKFCNTYTEEKYDLNQTVDASVYVMLKFDQSVDMPILNQRYEYYEPMDENLSSFHVISKERKYNFSNSSGYDCAKGGYRTTVDTYRNLGKREIEGKGTLTKVPWIVVFDNETNKAVKIIPAGYGVAYELNENVIINSEIWSDDDKKVDKQTDQKVRNRTFVFGPVADPILDPTVKENKSWIKDYLERQGIELPPGIVIPEPDQNEIQRKIPPDTLVKFGDGQTYFGGSGNKRISETSEFGFSREEQTYTWQMTRKKK